MKVTLQHISKDTGLSVSTVSRALRGDNNISKENEQKILEAAQRLGYPIVQRNTPINLRNEIYIAFVSGFHEGEFYASLFNGFTEIQTKRKVRVSAFSTLHLDESIPEFLSELSKNQFDAAVIFLPGLNHNDYKEIIDKVPSDFPVISTAPITNPIMDTVSFDSYGGGHQVAEHFIDKGYKKLGLIKGAANTLEAKFRANGFLDHVQTVEGTKVSWIYSGDYSAESGREALKEFLNLEDKPDAIFASNDVMAIGFLESARAKGINIPEDVAIAGFDNLPFTRYHHPSITTIETDYRQLAQTAVDQVLQRLENPSSHKGYLNLVPVTLAKRESS